MKETGEDATSLLVNRQTVIPTNTIASEALKEHNEYIQKERVIKNT